MQLSLFPVYYFACYTAPLLTPDKRQSAAGAAVCAHGSVTAAVRPIGVLIDGCPALFRPPRLIGHASSSVAHVCLSADFSHLRDIRSTFCGFIWFFDTFFLAGLTFPEKLLVFPFRSERDGLLSLNVLVFSRVFFMSLPKFSYFFYPRV